MRAADIVLPIALLVGGHAVAQTTTPEASPPPQAEAPPADQDDEPAWAVSAAVSVYVLPDDTTFVLPVLTADHERLRLEVRYNYEALEAGSIWVGCNFGGGDGLAWTLSPMLGAVVGSTNGVAPGYKGSLGWRRLEFYSEGEYVFDTGDSSASFFYNWSELSVAPLEWFRFGLVTQRTRVYDAPRDIQRGVLAGVSAGRLDLTAYVLNPDQSRPTVVITASLAF